jgi:hypothetical protein
MLGDLGFDGRTCSGHLITPVIVVLTLSLMDVAPATIMKTSGYGGDRTAHLFVCLLSGAQAGRARSRVCSITRVNVSYSTGLGM